MNIYAYTMDDPVNHTDPTGKFIGYHTTNDFGAGDLTEIVFDQAVSDNLAASMQDQTNYNAAANYFGAGNYSGGSITDVNFSIPLPTPSQLERAGQAMVSDGVTLGVDALGVVGGGVLGVITNPDKLGSDDTINSFTFYHYGSTSDAVSLQGGLWANSFITNVGNYTAQQAQAYLALSRTPNAVYVVQIPPTMPLIGPGIVRGNQYGPGGGTEWITTQPTGPGSVTGPFPLGSH